MTYWLSKVFSRLACLLPHGFAMRLGEILGHVTWWAVPKKRRDMAVGQVVRCLGVNRQEGLRIARASWERFGPMIMEVMRFPVTVGRMKDFVRIEGAEYLAEGLKEGKGAVIATSHAGNWELMGGALCQAGFPIVGVAQKQKEAGFNRFINEYRRLIGMHITYKTDVREMYKLMGEGKVIGLLSDQDSDIRDGIRFPGLAGSLRILSRDRRCWPVSGELPSIPDLLPVIRTVLIQSQFILGSRWKKPAIRKPISARPSWRYPPCWSGISAATRRNGSGSTTAGSP